MIHTHIDPYKIKKRNPFLAFLLAFIASPIGQVYNGQWKKGVLFLIISFLIPFFCGYFRLGIGFIGYISFGIIDTAFKIYMIADAVYFARKLKNYSPQPFNRWYFHLIFSVAIITFQYFYDYSTVVGIQSFNIPDTANSPTLKIGDRVVADLKAYKKKKPEYGDLVVFKQKDSVNPFVYRVVALPRDTIEIQNGFLTINGKKATTTYIQEIASTGLPGKEYKEELPNGHKYSIYKLNYPYGEEDNTISKKIIPENHYFVMGDNRFNASDSRYIGVIHKDEIMGRILFGFWGETNDRINIDFTDK